MSLATELKNSEMLLRPFVREPEDSLGAYFDDGRVSLRQINDIVAFAAELEVIAVAVADSNCVEYDAADRD